MRRKRQKCLNTKFVKYQEDVDDNLDHVIRHYTNDVYSYCTVPYHQLYDITENLTRAVEDFWDA